MWGEGKGVGVARLGRRSSAAEVGERLGSSRGEIEVEHFKGRREGRQGGGAREINSTDLAT